MTQNKRSRIEGLIYLISVLTGLFGLMYVPTQLFDMQDISQTILNINEHRLLFGFGILSELTCYIAFLLIPFFLYRHFRPYNRLAAMIMIGLVTVAVSLSCTAVSHKIDILRFLNDANISSEKLQELTYFTLKSYYSSINVAQVFWGLWLIPFGYLGYTSGKIPRILSVFLMIGGLGYLINFVGPIVMPEFKETLIPKIAKIPSTIGEIGTCLWLLLIGVKTD